ncbi:hypothetical protein C6P42_002415, partial [Pichia californica]
MFTPKQETQNNTESDAQKARLNYGAEKEKQIMNQIRSNAMQRQNSSSFFQSTMLG